MNSLRRMGGLVAWAVMIAGAAAGEQGASTIGTGGVSGNYYAAGSAICQVFNKAVPKMSGKASGPRCKVKSTEGSLANVNGLKAGTFEFGIVQSDIQYNAARGLVQFAGARIDELRAVFSIYPEPLTVLARKEVGVSRFQDFRGKRLSVGSPGSGTRATTDMLLAALKIDAKDFALVTELTPEEHGAALCANRIDGFAYVVGSPVSNIHAPAASCGARLVSVTGPEVDQLVIRHPYLVFATIPGGMYPGNPEPTKTFGVVAGLLSSARVSEQTVYELVAAVFDHFDEFKKLNPAFAHLEREEMIHNALSAPLHDGAVRYYKEKGWIRGGD